MEMRDEEQKDGQTLITLNASTWDARPHMVHSSNTFNYSLPISSHSIESCRYSDTWNAFQA